MFINTHRSADNCTTAIVEKILSNRKIILEFEDETISTFVSRGCPHGGVLSPILSNIVVDGLIHILNKSGYYCHFSQKHTRVLSLIYLIMLLAKQRNGVTPMI